MVKYKLGMDQRRPLFLYGIMQSDAILESVIGERLQRTLATLNDFALYVQRIDQVPDTAPSHLPSDLAPQRILRKNRDGDFESYMVRPKKGGEVAGSIVYATPLQIALLDDWELCELGWYREWEGDASTADGNTIKIVTQGGRMDQAVDREVDGLHYPTLLEGQSVDAFKRVAEEARMEFFARTNPEGAMVGTAAGARK